MMPRNQCNSLKSVDSSEVSASDQNHIFEQLMRPQVEEMISEEAENSPADTSVGVRAADAE